MLNQTRGVHGTGSKWLGSAPGLAAALMVLSYPGLAQKAGPPTPDGGARVQPTNTKQAPFTLPEPGVVAGATVQRDRDTGQIRRIRGSVAPLATQSAPAAARAFLYANRKALRLSDGITELALDRQVESLGGFHVTYKQLLAGLPVFGGSLSVHMDRGLRITSANLDLVPVAEARRFGPAGNPDRAIATAVAAVAAQSPPRQAPVAQEGIWVQKGRAEQVFRVTFGTITPAGAWEIMVRASDLAILSRRNIARFADGTGMVYLPNPVVVTGDATLTDIANADSPPLTAARSSVTLRGLDGSGNLTGTYCTTAPSATITRAFSAGLTFNYTRSQSGFDETMAYYHIDRVARYAQSLGFTNIQNRQTGVDVNGTTEDNAWYDPSTGDLTFGSGGVNDAQDAHVIWHECGHAVQDNQVPGFGSSAEGGAVGEGFGDYWAVTQFAGLGPMGAAWDIYVAEWDAASYSSSIPPYLRRLDSTKHYPEDWVGEVHDDGEIWSACLWQIRGLIGATRADTIILESHFSLSPLCTFADAAEAIIAANQALYADADRRAIRIVFIDRGILQAETASSMAVVPIAAHPGDGVTLSATLTQASSHAPVADVDVELRLNGALIGVDTTDADGAAALDFLLPNTYSLGTRTISARFAGNYDIAPSMGSADLTVVGFRIAGHVTEGGDPLAGATVRAVGPGMVTAAYSVSPGLSIPDDNVAGIASTIVIPSGGEIASLRVGVDITHSYRGDLRVSLSHPDGTTVVLHDQAGGSLDDLVTSYPDLTAPVESLDLLRDKPAAGTWTLKVSDLGAIDTGTLNSWSITVEARSSSAETNATSDATGAFELSVMPGTFTVSALLTGFSLSPASRSATVPPDQDGVDFAALGTPTELSLGSVTGNSGDAVNLRALLGIRSSHAALAGMPIAFTVNGAGAGAATTGADGVAQTPYTLPAGLLVGAYPVTARFAGSAPHNPSEATAALTVPGFNISGSIMQVGGPVAGATVTASSPQPTESTYRSSPGTPIPDADTTGIEAPIVVPDSGAVAGLKVGVDITHTWIGDLTVTLRHPDGTDVILHNRTGGSLDNIITSYPDLTVPAQSLGALFGKPMAGTWKLIVKDTVSGDLGTLNAWGLTITHDVLQPVASAVSSSAGTYQIGSLNAGTYTLTAAKPGYALTPATLGVTLGPSATGADFRSSLISTTLTMPSKSGFVGGAVSLSATLTQTTPGAALAGKNIAFSVDGASAGTATTDAAGVATLAYTIPADAVPGTWPIAASFAGDGTLAPVEAAATLTVAKAASALYMPDRTGVITTAIALKAYLRRTSDSAKLSGRTVAFSVAGTAVGSAVTSVDGEATLLWTVTAGSAGRPLGGSFAGDTVYLPCTGSAVLTSTTVATKVYVVDRTNVKIKTYTVLKAYLYTTANVILPGKTLTMTVDGASLGSQATNSSGYVSFGYTVPEAVGAGNRVVGASWAGNAGYPASSNTGKLGVVQGNLYIWPYVRSGKRGTVHPLKAYVRSLPDYVIQPGKSITFKVNGSTIGSANVAADGWATVNWSIPAGEATGAHTATAEFAGDAWYVAVTANTAFNVVP